MCVYIPTIRLKFNTGVPQNVHEICKSSKFGLNNFFLYFFKVLVSFPSQNFFPGHKLSFLNFFPILLKFKVLGFYSPVLQNASPEKALYLLTKMTCSNKIWTKNFSINPFSSIKLLQSYIKGNTYLHYKMPVGGTAKCQFFAQFVKFSLSLKCSTLFFPFFKLSEFTR